MSACKSLPFILVYTPLAQSTPQSPASYKIFRIGDIEDTTMGSCREDVTPVRKQWSYIFLAPIDISSWHDIFNVLVSLCLKLYTNNIRLTLYKYAIITLITKRICLYHSADDCAVVIARNNPRWLLYVQFRGILEQLPFSDLFAYVCIIGSVLY